MISGHIPALLLKEAIEWYEAVRVHRNKETAYFTGKFFLNNIELDEYGSIHGVWGEWFLVLNFPQLILQITKDNHVFTIKDGTILYDIGETEE